MGSFWTETVVSLALPFGVYWVSKQEARILRDGRCLSEWETKWAHDVGVENPDKVRILPVPKVPVPFAPILRLNGAFSGVSGMALNYGIFLDTAHQSNPNLLVHELAHVAQYEKMGGIRGFLREYLTQCVEDGYWNSLMEQEARDAAAPFSQPPGQ